MQNELKQFYGGGGYDLMVCLVSFQKKKKIEEREGKRKDKKKEKSEKGKCQ